MTSPVRPTVHRGCIESFAVRVCVSGENASLGSCGRRAWVGRCRGVGSQPPSPIPTSSRSICSSGTSHRARSSSTASMSVTSPTSAPGKAGCISRPSSISRHDASSGGRWPITCAPSWSATRSAWPSRTAGPRRRSRCSTPTAAPNTRSKEFTDLLADHKMIQSLSRPRQCWDNAVAESFFASLKNRMHLPAVVGDADTGTSRRVRLHRGLLQPASSAFRDRVLPTRRIRSNDPPPHDRSRGITTMSGEPGQAQRCLKFLAWIRRQSSSVGTSR